MNADTGTPGPWKALLDADPVTGKVNGYAIMGGADVDYAYPRVAFVHTGGTDADTIAMAPMREQQLMSCHNANICLMEALEIVYSMTKTPFMGSQIRNFIRDKLAQVSKDGVT